MASEKEAAMAAMHEADARHETAMHEAAMSAMHEAEARHETAMQEVETRYDDALVEAGRLHAEP